VSEYLVTKPIRTGTLTQMVVQKYGGDHGAENLSKYIPLTQVASSTGGANNIADVMVLGAWHSSGNELEGFEVKVSRADWLNEVKNPDKCQPTKRFCDRWWLVIADKSMVKDGELPEDWGMMAVVDGSLKVIKKAPLLQAEPMSHDFVASLLRTDARGNIPLDVHNDKMLDLKREYEAEYKARYAGLLQFVKELHSELGIKIENSNSKGNEANWYARIGSHSIRQMLPNGGWNLTAKQLAAAVKIALNGDMDTMKYRLESLNSAAEEIIKITKDFQKDDIRS
jgi:hypothetical protein